MRFFNDFELKLLIFTMCLFFKNVYKLEPMKLLQDPFHPPELQAVVSLLLENVIKAKDFLNEMALVAT